MMIGKEIILLNSCNRVLFFCVVGASSTRNESTTPERCPHCPRVGTMTTCYNQVTRLSSWLSFRVFELEIVMALRMVQIARDAIIPAKIVLS